MTEDTKTLTRRGTLEMSTDSRTAGAAWGQVTAGCRYYVQAFSRPWLFIVGFMAANIAARFVALVIANLIEALWGLVWF